VWEIDASVIGAWLANVLLPFFRISSFFILAPVLGTKLVPGRVRIILSFLVTLAVVPVLPKMPPVDMVSFDGFILVGQQVLIGLCMALVLQLLLQMFVLAGQLIAMQMGLGFASMMDPANGISVTVVSQFHLMLVTLLFVTMNGHLAMIEVMVESFNVLPITDGFVSSNALYTVIGWASWMFAGGVLMSLPAVASLLVINAALGVITRAAPQLNIFAVGFPFMLVIGLFILWLTLRSYLPHFDHFTREALEMMASVVKIK
jgi:flagellar biosynthetic protein FliR